MKNIIFSFVLGMFMLSIVLFGALPALAIGQGLEEDIRSETEKVGGAAFGEQGGEGELLTVRIGNIIKVVLGFVGVIVVIIVVYAGFMWMTAGGTEEKVKKAQQWMINAVIGLAITLSAYAITDFVIDRLIQAGTE